MYKKIYHISVIMLHQLKVELAPKPIHMDYRT